MEGFFNLYRHGFIRVAVGIPRVQVADPAFNARETLALMEKAAQGDAVLALFPELGLSAYSCEDLFHQKALLDASQEALKAIVEASRELPLIALVGLPLKVDHLLYNCAAVIQQGRLLGMVPKSFLPNYREFYELRQFTPAFAATATSIELFGQEVPFGNRLLFRHASEPLFSFFAEICEDLWVPIPPSTYAAMAGATLLLNLSASNITIGKAEYRRELVGHQSARCLSAYAYCAAGMGESTTDLAWDGHALIYENGRRIAESERFAYESQLVFGDIDLEHLSAERMRQNSFSQAVRYHQKEIGAFRTLPFSLPLPDKERLLISLPPERFPYVPADPSQRDRRCQEVYAIQVQGLAKRLQATGIEKIVIGVSGGLDSTQALIVCARTMDILGLPRKNILAYTMPGFATSERTLKQARALMEAVGASAHEIDIRPSCLQMLKDIGHPYAEGKPVYDTTFENVQAGERTSHLFRIANLHGGLVVGTSDLSELALGWCTYGVGDHMAHYHVNASVPKTLIQYLIRWVADTHQINAEASPVLYDVLDTVISPELVP
ncbi:MAG: NAD(+) synthase, partial [Gammaproteobacteria bacterium]